MRAITILGPTLLLSLVVASTACQTVTPDDNNPFATAPPMTSAPPTSDTGDETETGGSTSSGGSESSTGPASTTAPLDTGTSLPPLTTGMSMEDSSSSGGGGNGMQPASGMWMPCVVPEDCDYNPSLCITIGDFGGFCSDVGCNNPAADCAPSPNGIAVPTCVPIDVGGMADTACVLQCTGGTACPAPMQCVNVEVIGEVCV